MSKEKPNYYAIIPAFVRYDEKLKPNEKILYGEITALANKEGFCWAKNEYFANLYDVAKSTISRWISNLKSRGYIKVKINCNDGNNRKIFLNNSRGLEENLNRGLEENVNPPIEEIRKHNNTSNYNNIKSINNIWEFYQKTFKNIYEPRKLTQKRKAHINARLKTYTEEELKEALINMANDDYLTGKNEKNKVYSTPEYCFRNDEIIEKWLNRSGMNEKQISGNNRGKEKETEEESIFRTG